MFKRMLSALALTLTLTAVLGLAAQQSPTPDPGCYPDGCSTGNLK